MKRLHNKVNKEELKLKMLNSNEERTTLSFYNYAHISNPQQFRDELYQSLAEVETLSLIHI